MLTQEIRWAAAHVLLDPARIRVLLAGGPENARALRTFFFSILPRARAALTLLEREAVRIPDDVLRAKALNTLHAKAYHVAGACVLATFLPRKSREHYIDIVAPLETIYDFLDTLCDRDPQPGERASRQLHLALSDALDPQREMHDYFQHGPAGADGGYLATLVRMVRDRLAQLEHHEQLVPRFQEAAQLYSDTQTFKQLPAAERELAYTGWFARSGFPAGFRWFELGAAAGSQFHVYGPLFAAFCKRLETVEATYDAYFPELAALHVLLDAFIDQAEDREHGELNWVGCYGEAAPFLERMRELATLSREKFAGLPFPAAHNFTLRLMSLFYLTHPKVWEQRLQAQSSVLLRALVPA